MQPTNGSAGLPSARLLLVEILENRLCASASSSPQLPQLRSSCRGSHRQPPPSLCPGSCRDSYLPPPTCLLFCKYNVRPWQINKLTSAPERAAGFRCRGKNHQPSSYLKRFKRVEKSGSGSSCISSPDGDGGGMGQVAGLAAGKSVGGSHPLSAIRQGDTARYRRTPKTQVAKTTGTRQEDRGLREYSEAWLKSTKPRKFLRSQ